MKLIIALFSLLLFIKAYSQDMSATRVSIKPDNCFYNYKYENNKVYQTIKLKIVENNKIAFTIETFNKLKKCKSFFSDTALVYHVDGADDIYEYQDNYQSNPYPVVKFVYDGKFFLAFNIEYPNKKRISVEEADGSINYRPKDCPFDLGKTLTLIK